MDKLGRATVSKIVSELEELAGRLSDLRDAEQEKFDNLPEGLQGSDRGEKLQEGIDTLTGAVDELESQASNLGELANG